MTSSVSVQGSYLARSQDLATGGSGGEPRRVVVRCRCCHFCCRRPSGSGWVRSTTTHVPARLADQAKSSLSVAGVSRHLSGRRRSRFCACTGHAITPRLLAPPPAAGNDATSRLGFGDDGGPGRGGCPDLTACLTSCRGRQERDHQSSSDYVLVSRSKWSCA